MSLARTVALVIVAVSLFGSQPGLAKTYKWVDENGVTQYTQTPPPKGDFENIKAPPKPAIDPAEAKSKLQEKVDAFDERRTEADKSQTEANKKQAEADKNKADCEQLKKNLALFEAKSRIKFTDEKGNVTLMPEEERQAKMQEMRDNMKKVCK